MTLRDWPVIVACVLGLSLVLLVIWRGRRSPLAAPLALLGLDLTTWNFADDAYHASGEKVVVWHLLDHTLSPLTIPLALAFVLVFVGQRKRLRWLLAVSWVWAMATGIPSVFAMIGELGPLANWGRTFTEEGGPWYPLNLAHIGVMAPIGLGLLVRHTIRAGPEERRRAVGVLAAIGVLVVLGLSEFLPGPGLGLLGFVVFTVILSVLVLQPGFELSIPRKLIPIAVMAASFGVIAWLFVAKRANGPAVVLLVLTVASLVVLVIGLGLQARRIQEQQKLKELAHLGAVADQLAHNLKNPLAALKGASEYLEEELHRGRSLEDQEKFVRLLLAQVDRLEKVVHDYRKLGGTEPVIEPLDLNSVVSQVLALQSFADGERVRIRSELDGSLPPINGDPGLLRETLENLLRNAAEALPNGGNVTVRTGWSDPNHVFLSVQDDGVGMDARTRERLRKYYTTKPGGSGLGLAFAEKVAKEHGGELKITSESGRGTTVVVALAAR